MPEERRSRRHSRPSCFLRVQPASPAFDGVFNRLTDLEGFAAEAREGRQLGFDGKSLIHPDQIEPCNRAFGPSERRDRARAQARRCFQRRRRALRGPDDRAHARRGGAADARAGRSDPEEPMIKRLLRAAATAFHKMLAVVWFFRRPKTYGAHAVALTPEGTVVLVRLWYAPGWRLPGGGRSRKRAAGRRCPS